jgi:PAS domain S-box-containing protein
VSEVERVKALAHYRILDTPAEETFTRLARLAATIAGTSGAAITFVDESRVWTKAAHGESLRQIPRAYSFCAHAVQGSSPLVVENATADARFAQNPLVVGEPGLRFYAGIPIRTPDGHAVGTLSVVDYQPRTISESQLGALRDLADAAAGALETRLSAPEWRSIFDEHPRAAWIYDPETLDIVAVNDFAVEQYGYARDEFLRLQLTHFQPPTDPLVATEPADADAGAAPATPHGGTSRSGPLRHVRKNGSVLYVEISSQPISYGGKDCCLVIAHDVSEQETWKRAHRLTEQRFSLLVDAVEEYAIVVLDPVGRVMTWNRGANRLYGYREDEIVGRHLSVFYPDVEEARTRLSSLLQFATTEGRHRSEAALVRKDGEVFWADILLLPLRDEHSFLLGYAQITRDVTVVRHHEQMLMEARVRAETKSRLKSMYLSSMSHQVRTPLTGIIGFAELLEEKAPPEVQRLIRSIHRNGQLLLETLDTVLEFVRLESEEAPLKVEALDLREHVGAVVARYEPQAAEQGIKLEVEPGDPVTAQASLDALRRVIAHLVRNALKFTPEGEVRIRILTTGPEAIVEVEDTGTGISSDFLPFVFDEFQQEPQVDGREVGGCGLGLAIVRHQVERMGGAISVDSEPGRGSRFRVRLVAA